MALTLPEIQALDQQYFLPVFGPRTPVAFTHGEGCTLYATDGKAYTDFLGGIAVTALGHSHPAVVQAIQEQAGKLIHTSSLYYIEQQARLAQCLVENSVLDRVFLGNSGAEANEAALKLARKYFYAKGEDRYEVITALSSFHGRTMATVAATGQPKYQAPYAPLTPGFAHVPLNDLPALEQAIGPHTAAILLETIQGEGGVIEASPAYLQGAQALCREHGILLILDEVQTGMGRTGKLFSYEHFGLKPDIMTLAKALGNGFPIGAVLCSQAVADALSPGDHGSTFGGGPLACSAALAVMDQMLHTDLLERCVSTGAYFKDQLVSLANAHPSAVRLVRGQGMLLGLALTPDIDGKSAVSYCLDRQLLINCAGDNTLRFAPPLILPTAAIDTLVSALDAFLTQQEDKA